MMAAISSSSFTKDETDPAREHRLCPCVPGWKACRRNERTNHMHCSQYIFFP